MPTGDANFSWHLVPFLWDLHMFYLLRSILFPNLSLFFRTMLYEYHSVLLPFTLKGMTAIIFNCTHKFCTDRMCELPVVLSHVLSYLQGLFCLLLLGWLFVPVYIASGVNNFVKKLSYWFSIINNYLLNYALFSLMVLIMLNKEAISNKTSWNCCYCELMTKLIFLLLVIYIWYSTL